eukprot:s926_g13.t2
MRGYGILPFWVDHWRRSGDMENLLDMLEVQIQALLDLEVPDEALPLAQEAVKVAKRTKKKKLEGQALASLAQVQQAREEHVEALSASKEAIVIFRELGDQVAEAGARHAAVSAYMGRKKLGEALDEAKKARAIFRKHGLRHDEGRALLVKSCAHKMAQELGEAVQDATEAQYLFQKEKDRRWEAKALHDVAELQAMRENFPAAMRAAKKAEQLVQVASPFLTADEMLLSISIPPEEYDPDWLEVPAPRRRAWETLRSVTFGTDAQLRFTGKMKGHGELVPSERILQTGNSVRFVNMDWDLWWGHLQRSLHLHVQLQTAIDTAGLTLTTLRHNWKIAFLDRGINVFNGDVLIFDSGEVQLRDYNGKRIVQPSFSLDAPPVTWVSSTAS